jgi:sugar (pentulose or hexulose) kinase
MSVLVVDVGTSDVRASAVRPDGPIECMRWRVVLAVSPETPDCRSSTSGR